MSVIENEKDNESTGASESEYAVTASDPVGALDEWDIAVLAEAIAGSLVCDHFNGRFRQSYPDAYAFLLEDRPQLTEALRNTLRSEAELFRPTPPSGSVSEDAQVNGQSSGEANTAKDPAGLQDALLDLRARLLTPAGKWNAQRRTEALALIDRALGDPVTTAHVKSRANHFAAGAQACRAGAPRTLPSYFTEPRGKNAQGWLKGYDSVDLTRELCEAITRAGYRWRRYSGRGMYGKECVGVDLADSHALYALSQALADREKDAPQTENMGRGIIAYWPRRLFRSSGA